MMIARVFCALICVAFSIVTVDGVVNSKRWTTNDECGVANFGVYRNPTGQWPFVALIYYINQERIYFVCGGTIISKSAIITGE
jgi:hypothetical protein